MIFKCYNNSIMKSFLAKRNIYLIIIFFVFFGLFCFTKDKILFTPDFIGDAYHGDISSKFYLSQMYKNNILPFWTNKLGNGYPLIADNLAGSLFLPNLILLKFFSFNIGYNLIFITTLFIIAVGFFLILSELGISKLLSLLLSLNFAFNASITLRFIHLTIIQPFSLFPLLFFLLLVYFKNNQNKYFYLSAFTASQMIYAGHPQVSFMAFFAIFIFLFFYLIIQKNIEPQKKMEKFFKFLAIILLAFCLSLPQLLPTVQFHQFLKRSPNLNFQGATAYSFSWNNLVSFVFPYAFGNPKTGTYNFFQSSQDIFWENTPYIGKWLFYSFLSAVLYIKVFVKKIDKNFFKLNLIFLLLFLIFILFALGKNSPIYFIFSFPPFNFFRTQSRYLLFAAFFLFLFISYLFNQVWKDRLVTKIILVIILAINLFELVNFAYNYHLLADYKKVIQKPAIVAKMDESKYINLEQSGKWNKTFLNLGWAKKTDIEDYLFFRNFLYPNSGLIFSKSSFSVNFPATSFNRINIFQDLLKSNVDDDKEILKLIGIKYIITSDTIADEDFKLNLSLSRRDIKINLFEFKKYSNNFYYIPKKIQKITYLEEFKDLFDKKNNFESLAVYEDSVFDKLLKSIPTKFKIISSLNSDNNISITGQFSGETLLVVKENYYPEWKATIDGKVTKIYPINLIHIGVIMPAGRHTLVIYYYPSSFVKGIIISLLTIVLLLIFHNRSKLNFFERS